MKTMKQVCATAVAVGSITALAACGGGVADTTSEGGDVGFAYGAEQSEVDEILADLDPVELTYQTAVASAEAPTASSALSFKEAIEERSDGKITVNIAWAQSIASTPEIDDALADGRLDIALSSPVYQPAEYPIVDALSKSTGFVPPSPMVGELVRAAVMNELAWTSDVPTEYSDKGLTALAPAVGTGEYFTACTDSGTSPDDWGGRQIRVASAAHHDLFNSIGGTPVSMEYNEVFEALQRGTVDCTLVAMSTAGQTGLLEVAPHVGYSTEFSFAGSAGSAHVAGSSFKDLPLAYQQIIFDADIDAAHGFIQSTLDTTLDALADSASVGGEVQEIDPAAQADMKEAQQKILDEVAQSGLLGDDVEARATESAEKWFAVADELGFTDGGDFDSFSEWYEAGSVDFRPFTTRVYEETTMTHRPE